MRARSNRSTRKDNTASLTLVRRYQWSNYHPYSEPWLSSSSKTYYGDFLSEFFFSTMFCDVVLDVVTIGTTSGNPRENSMNGKLGDVTCSLFQVTNDNVEQNLSQQQPLGEDAANSSLS